MSLKKELRTNFRKVRKIIRKMEDGEEKRKLIDRIREDRNKFRLGRNPLKRLIKISHRILRRCENLGDDKEFRKILVHRLEEIINRISFRLKNEKDDKYKEELINLKEKLLKKREDMSKNNH